MRRKGERLSGKRFRNFLFRRLPVFPRPAAHCDADDDRDGQEYDRARDDQPRIERRAAYRQLRRREERYGECEQHGEESAAADTPHPGVASRHAVAAGQVGLRIAQADACGVHHHVHNQVEPDGEGAQQEKGDAYVFHHDVQRREHRDDAALDHQDVDLDAVLVGLFHKFGQLALFGRPEQAPAGARYPRHHARQDAESDQQAHDVREPADAVVLEYDVERREQSRLEVDLVVRRNDGYGQRAEREKPEGDQRGQEHGFRKLFLRLFELGSVHRVHFDAGEKQQDTRQERDVAHARDVREKAGVRVLRRVGAYDLRNARRDVFERDFITAGDPRQRHRHDHHARKHRPDQESLARQAGSGRRAPQGHPRGRPIHDDRKQSDENAVLREGGHPDHVGDRRRGESQHGGIPYHVLNPLEEDRREPHVRIESLFDPRIDAAAPGGEGAAQLGPDQRGGDKEQERSEKNVEEHRKFFLRHHRQSPQADYGGGRHQRELHGRNVFAFSHRVGKFENTFFESFSFRAKRGAFRRIASACRPGRRQFGASGPARAQDSFRFRVSQYLTVRSCKCAFFYAFPDCSVW